MSQMRVGIGFDLHPLREGRPLVLGGVSVPFEKGLGGHSDADVLVHALIDALLGGAGLGDIGQHFPDTDPQYQGISSLELLRRTMEILRAGGWRPVNVDATIVAERPSLLPFIPEMKQRLAAVLGLALAEVSVKAKRAEGLGFLGRGEGMAVYAVALVERI